MVDTMDLKSIALAACGFESHHPYMNCIICNEPLKSDSNFVYGTQFVAYGNYGSTVWDPPGMGGTDHLLCYICDPCMIDNKYNITLAKRVKITNSDWELSPWNGPERFD